MAELRAGLVGMGMMGRNHARVLNSLDGVELVGVADPAGDKHGLGVAVFADLAELLAEGLDYCVVAAPTALHEQIALQLADAGVAMLIEKPIAASVEAAQRIMDAFATKGLVGAVGHIERYNPSLQEARRRLENGDLGEVFQVATRRQGPFPARISDVGVVKDLATHDIDLTAWITQQPYAAVSARTAYRSGREHEDLVAVTGQLADGTVTSHLVNWLSPMKERVTVITGERGAFIADTLTADLTFIANGSIPSEWPALAEFRGVSEGDLIRFAIPKPEPLRTEHTMFRDAVRGDDAQVVSLEAGTAVVRVAEACLESAQTGATVSLVE